MNDFIFKIILIGDSGVGKTSIINKYCNGEFTLCHDLTIGVDFGCRVVQINQSNGSNKKITVKCQLWDTAGQERFRSIIRSYYHNVAGILLCYDITRLDTFDNVVMWLNEIKCNSSSDARIMLVGTKSDLENRRVIDTETGQNLAKQYNLLFCEISSKNNINLNQMFNGLVSEIYRGYIDGTVRSGVQQTEIDRNVIPINDVLSHRSCC